MTIAQKLSYKLQPYEWQLKAIAKFEEVEEYALFAEVGAGKSCAAVNSMRTKYYKHGKLLKTIIISPLVTLYNWKNEIQMHSTIKDTDIVVLDVASKRVRKTTDALMNPVTKKLDNAKIVVVNYEAMLSESFFKLIKDWEPEIMLLDEMHYIKNYKSKRAKKIIQISDNSTYRLGLTGTPILNTPMDIYMQFRFLDKGNTFGRNFFAFRAKYFQDANAKWAGRKGHFPKFEPIPTLFPELTDKIYKKAIRVTKEECMDLPPLIKKTMYAPMNKEQLSAYKSMKKEFVACIKDAKSGEDKVSIAQIALTKALRLQQIVSGFITDEEGNNHSFGETPRLKLTKELLQDITPNHKVIVWCAFKNDYQEIVKICEELGVGYGLITGEQTLVEKQASMDDLKNRDDCRVIVANRRAGGIGINLIEASYSIIYSRNFSLGEEIQSEARNYRGGSQIHERIIKIDLVTKDSIDETVLNALRLKQDVSDMIIDLKF